MQVLHPERKFCTQKSWAENKVAGSGQTPAGISVTIDDNGKVYSAGMKRLNQGEKLEVRDYIGFL
ncbi:hypothetical protein [Parendozoicomonas sp. Alg238-R29]|uniref:hypothetical protein n=1 Tax=Parendozoicomonas sp. Alg238-R29 TaxID=2993446 RepID=UPI00248EFD42|nr:hypothetical protein [Parendozoicomonas sp. Alg238-R29]